MLPCSSACHAVWAARLPSSELMPPCPRAAATQLWFIHFYCENTHARAHARAHTHTKQIHLIESSTNNHCTLRTLTTVETQIPHRSTNTLALTRITKHDKSSVLCCAVLRMMMLISMCLPHHHSEWLDWPLVGMTRDSLLFDGLLQK